MTIDTNGQFEIIKVSERVFRIGDIELDNSSFNSSFISLIINIIDNGFKFIPCTHLNVFHIFKNLLFDIEKEIVSFNRQFFIKNLFSKNSLSNSQNNNSSDISSQNNNFSDNSLTKNKYTCDSLECFFSKNNNSKNKKFLNLGLNRESILFQLELYCNLSQLEVNNEKNLSYDELKALKLFLLKKPFKVVELDKNIGAGIISNELYNNLTESLLQKTDTYIICESDPTDRLISDYIDLINFCFEKKHISKKLKNFLYITDCKLGTFRVLPKLHKTKFSLRPIISYKKHITRLICGLIDLIIRPYVTESESYVKDSQDFILKTKDLEIPIEAFLFSCDFESLYTNIIHEILLNLFSDFFKDKIKIEENEHLDFKAFMLFLKFILYNNYFKFNKKFYRQILGIAMGSVCGPSIANLFVLLYEKKWLIIHRPLIYRRFIDDIFILLDNISKIFSLCEAFGSLKLNYITDKQVNFLDLIISIDKITNRLTYNVYIKPTNTFTYLSINSNHPKHIYENIIKSTFIRYRRICSFLNDFIYMATLVSRQFIKRGYNKKLIYKIFSMVTDLDRNSLLEYKEKDNTLNKNTFIFKTVFDKNMININEIIRNSFKYLKKEFPSFEDKEILIVNKMQFNLSSLMVHNFRINFSKNNNFIRCKDSNCLICKFSNNDSYLKLKDNFILPFYESSNCNSVDSIYILKCNLCNAFYVGQTKNLKKRINSHLYNIKSFIPFNENNTCISIHFNLKPHNFIYHFSFYVFRSDIYELSDRLNIESFLINLFVKMKLNLLNDFIPYLKDQYMN
jgi:hypothetical protein